MTKQEETYRKISLMFEKTTKPKRQGIHKITHHEDSEGSEGYKGDCCGFRGSDGVGWFQMVRSD